MTNTDIIGFTGVTILLGAYFLNLNNKRNKDNITYLLMNFFGAGLACFASLIINYVLFIILEGSWTLVSGIGIIEKFEY
jgi:hypothetical protein